MTSTKGPQPADLARAGTEHAEQVALFAWAALHFARWPDLRHMFAIPNGGERNVIVATKLKAEGVRRHVADILLPVPRGPWHGLFIEMKKLGGRVHPGQAEFLEAMREQGYGACVCVGWQAGAEVLEKYLDWH